MHGPFFVFCDTILLVEVASLGKNLNIISLLSSVLLLMKMFEKSKKRDKWAHRRGIGTLVIQKSA